ncbi:unnamed protein product, partial [Effrenium voratum]
LAVEAALMLVRLAVEAATRLVRLAMEAATRPRVTKWRRRRHHEAEGDEAEGDEAGNGGGNEAGEVSTLLRLWWGEKRRPQAVGDTDNGDAAHSPDLLRPKSAAEQFQAANRLSEFLLQQAPTDLNRIQVLEAGLARQKEAPADVVTQDPRPAPKRPRRYYLEEATRALTGLSVGVRKVQDEKSLCISKGGGPAGARADLAILLIWDKDALGLVASTYKESAAAQALFDRPGRLCTGHHNNLYKGLVQELKKLEMQDQDNAIDKLLERI